MDDLTKLKINVLKLNQNVSNIHDFLMFLERCYNSVEAKLDKTNGNIKKHIRKCRLNMKQ